MEQLTAMIMEDSALDELIRDSESKVSNKSVNNQSNVNEFNNKSLKERIGNNTIVISSQFFRVNF